MGVTMCVTMELLSDAIFGSGFSVPGGEDIAVCRDKNGYPYLKGTTLKGLLRESMANLLAWTGSAAADLDEIMGAPGWEGTAEERRLHLTALTLDKPPADPDACFTMRTFTSLADGVVRQGTLRTAACVRRGLRFCGELTCAEQDISLVQDALAGIKWLGTMRSRGFGSVRIRGQRIAEAETGQSAVSGRCIRYRLRTQTPVIITDLGRSGENSYETRGYIPGSAVRGMVMNTLSAADPAWFDAHKHALLTDETRFSDAVPALSEAPVLPALKGFYETKEETGLENVLVVGEVQPGKKRAKLGSFCTLKDGVIHYWSAETDSALRIQRSTGAEEDTHPFQTRHLASGQEFDGYILLENEELAGRISSVLGGTVWLGADRFEGFGKCSVTALACADEPAWCSAFGYQRQEQVEKRLYLLAVSPLTMLNTMGEPCGLDADELAERLGVKRVEIRGCSTSLAEFGGFNRTWQCRQPALRMYDRGSVFALSCSDTPALERLRAIERSGLGVRRAEGFGQVLFLLPELLEGLHDKQPVRQAAEYGATQRMRDAEYRWVMENDAYVRKCRLSRSQIGTIQALCEQAIANGRDTGALLAHLDKNMNERGARHGSRFAAIDRLIRQVLDTPMDETLGLSGCAERRLELLCLLFDYSRKDNGKERA